MSSYCSTPIPAIQPPAFSAEALPWFAIHVRSNFEHMVSSQLEAKGFTVFLPQYRARRRWADRVKILDRPLFPGYLFCRLDCASPLPVLTTPGVASIVGAGKTPIPVDPGEIAAVQAVIASGVAAQPYPFLKAGQSIYLERGPLAGLEGIIVSLPNEYRLVVSVSLLQRSLSVEVDRDWIRPGSDFRPM
jgi:transcription antitermination factor NusG